MSDREHERVPFTVQVKYRTASSFLIAYSVNLSRGGLFLETDQTAEVGSMISLQLGVPGAGPILAKGRVSWCRKPGDADGPPGIGIEFRSIGESLGAVIDRLVADFEGVSVLLLCGDDQDRATLTRLIKSIISTADVVSAGDAHLAETLLDDSMDIAVIDTEYDSDAALGIVKLASRRPVPIPTIALVSSKRLRDRARVAGASELANNPPPFAELQKLLVRALGRPVSVR